MTLNYTLQQMKTFLERSGFECKLELETKSYSYGEIEQPFEFHVWNVYYKGEIVSNHMESYGGTKRLELIFEQEFTKRLLEYLI